MIKIPPRSVIILMTAMVFLFIPMPLTSQESGDALSNLANQIAEKRAALESLSSQLDSLKSEYNEELRSLASQKSDMETQIRREEIKREQINRDIEEYRSLLVDNSTSMAEIIPALEDLLADLHGYVAQGLPFQVPQRLGEIETLQAMMQDDRIKPENILARSWNLVESEFRLTSENGLYRQTIQIGGEEQLAEVVRLGMVMLYFHTFDGRYGYSLFIPREGWHYEYVYQRNEILQIEELFESLRKNLREGFFELPNPLSDRGKTL